MFVYGPRDRFSNFFRDGYLRVNDLGVDISRLKEEIRIAKGAESWEALSESDTANSPWFRNMHFHSLEPLVHNKAVLELLSFYMGSDVVINGYQYWHMHANSTTWQHRQTAEWHHDSCGTRAKIFIYLHDVDEDRLVTEIATGSQKAHKFTFGGVHPWFKTEAVEKTWRIDKMIGPAGGGFIFDPNTIHRAAAYKPHLARDAVIIDISSAVKADVGIPSKERPCPLHTWRTEAVNSRFEYPEQGHGPMTSELLLKNNGTKSFEEYYWQIRRQTSNESYKSLLDQVLLHGAGKKGKNRTQVRGRNVTKQKIGLVKPGGKDKSKERSELSEQPGCSDIPLPFSQGLIKIYGERVFPSWRYARSTDMLLFGSSDPAKYCGAVSRLVKDGLRWNYFGMDFSDVVHKRGLMGALDEDIKAAMAFYWGRRWSTEFLITLVDFELRYRPRNLKMLVFGAQDMFTSFFHNGYLKITDFGVDIDKLKEEIRVAKGAESWDQVHQGGTAWFKNMYFHSLDPLINNKGIMELISFYIGSDVVINGYQYWHVNANTTNKANRDLGEWHHDGCGTRAKIFLYLHDIDENGLMTEIAAGSQTLLKYTYGGSGSRSWFRNVSTDWRIDRMTGSRGGGFIFDPNTLHRAAMYKPHLARDVVVVDISSAVKSDVGLPTPQSACPPIAWRTEAVNSRFEYAEKGYGPITSELIKQNNGKRSYDEYYKQAVIAQKRREEEQRKRSTTTTTSITTSATTRKPKPKVKNTNPCAGRGRFCKIYTR